MPDVLQVVTDEKIVFFPRQRAVTSPPRSTINYANPYAKEDRILESREKNRGIHINSLIGHISRNNSLYANAPNSLHKKPATHGRAASCIPSFSPEILVQKSKRRSIALTSIKYVRRRREQRVDHLSRRSISLIRQMEEIETQKRDLIHTKLQCEKQQIHIHQAISNRELNQDELIDLALGFIHDARYKYKPRRFNIWQVQFYRSIWTQRLRTLLPIVHMCLSFFEPTTNTDPIKVYDYRKSVLFPVVVSIELLLILFYWFEVYLLLYQGEKKLYLPKNYIKYVIVVCLLTIDYFVEVCTPGPFIPRVLRFLRPIKLFISSRRLSHTVHSIVETIPKVFDVIILITLIMLLFGIFGLHLFYESYFSDAYINAIINATSHNKTLIWDYTKNVDDIYKRDKFNNIGSSLLTLLLLMTTETWPEAGKGAFNDTPAYILYFIVYICIMILCLTPVPVSVIYEVFKKVQVKRTKEYKQREIKCLMSAFICLGGNSEEELPSSQVERLLEGLLSTRDQPYAKMYLKELDVDGDGKIDEIEFLNLYEVVCWTVRQREPATDKCDGFRNKINEIFHFDKCVMSGWFQAVITLLIIFQTIVLGSYTTDTLMKEESYESQLIGWIFLVAFSLEAVLKIIGMGIESYWDDGWNKFDLAIIFLSILTELILPKVMIAETDDISTDNTSRALRIIRQGRLAKIARTLRVGRVLRAFRLISSAASTFARLDRMVRNIIIAVRGIYYAVIVWVCVVYWYALLGVELFF